MEFISVQNVTFRYNEEGENAKLVLDDVSFEVRQGEFVALLGHNGSGKSTIAKHLNAMLIPSSGKVYIDGMDTTDEAVTYDIRRKVGLVLQNPDNQLVASIVEEDVAFGPENLGIPADEIRVRVDEALKAVDMYDHRLKAPFKLIGSKRRSSSAAVRSREWRSRGSSRCGPTVSYWTSLPRCLILRADRRSLIPF